MERVTAPVGNLGKLTGIRFNGEVDRYLGVPYALPPVGDRRWRKPVALPNDYYSKGCRDSLDCTTFVKPCPQPVYSTVPIAVHDDDNDTQDPYCEETCLSMNIWIPQNTKKPENGWPVMVWYHGGWLQVGNPSSEPDMDPTKLITTAPLNAIFVAVGYRLSALGFLAGSALLKETGGEYVGNYGLWDQRLALEWVHENIADLGGDPTRVTISGRSAGAYSVHSQALHDFFVAKPTHNGGLFQSLVMYSNAIPNEPKSLTDVQSQFDSLVAACNISLDISPEEQLNQLRAVPASEIMSKIMNLEMHTFRPVSDGAFFPKNLFEKFDNLEFANEFKARNLRLLIGEVRDEETLYRETNSPHDLESLRVQVRNYYPPPIADALIDLYQNKHVKDGAAHPDPNPDVSPWKKVYGDIISDGQVRSPARLLVRQLAAAGVPLSSVYRYLISFRPGFIDRKAPKTFGVAHALDRPLWNYSTFEGPTPSEEKAMNDWIQVLVDIVNGNEINYGTSDWDEHKVFKPDGSIGVETDEKWEYLKIVANTMGSKH